MGKKLRTLLSVLLTWIVMTAGTQAVMADSYTGIGLQDNRDCSLQIRIVFTDDYYAAAPVPVSGAELTLVKVADLQTDGSYELVEPFVQLASWDSYINSGTSSDARRAADEAAAAAAEAVSSVKETTDGSGTAAFTVKDYGIYLLYQTGRTGTAAKCSVIQPMLVSLPEHSSANGWQYTVKSVPKVSLRTGTSVRIRKRACKNGSTTDEKVIGAKLQIVKADDKSVVEEWTTNSVDHDSSDLEPGEYILIETEAPAGYLKADPIAFTVTEDGMAEADGKVMENNEIIMNDPVDTSDESDDKDGGPHTDNSGGKQQLHGTSNDSGDDSENASGDVSGNASGNTAGFVETGIKSHPFAWAAAAAAACAVFLVIQKWKNRREKISD